jgi:hypothetical protein
VVDRRRLRRLEAETQRDGIVVRLEDGSTEVFSKYSPFYLWAADIEEGMADEERLEPPEPTTPHGWEALALREALENATPASKAANE